MLLCILKSATIAWILAHTTMNVAIIISELMTAFKLNTDKEVEVFEKFARYAIHSLKTLSKCICIFTQADIISVLIIN